MIVVVGVPAWRSGESPGADGRSARVALAAAAAGASVELVGRVGDDGRGDALLLALSRAGVGHAAVLRDPSRSTPTIDDDDDAAERFDTGGDAAVTDDSPARPTLDAGDLELGLRYLTDYRVLVVADPLSDPALRAIAEAARFTGAALVVLADEPPADDVLAPTTTVLQTPNDEDRSFAQLVAAYAVALDRGEPADAAFRAAVAGGGWEASED